MKLLFPLGASGKGEWSGWRGGPYEIIDMKCQGVNEVVKSCQLT